MKSKVMRKSTIFTRGPVCSKWEASPGQAKLKLAEDQAVAGGRPGQAKVQQRYSLQQVGGWGELTEVQALAGESTDQGNQVQGVAGGRSGQARPS